MDRERIENFRRHREGARQQHPLQTERERSDARGNTRDQARRHSDLIMSGVANLALSIED